MSSSSPRSAFAEAGLKQTILEVEREVAELYTADAVPWVVGYSGGKDSTAVLQLVWRALSALPQDRRSKPVHVISTDTLVENPIVAAWVTKSLESMDAAARDQGLPVTAHRLTPAVEDSFWVNLIGRGYPAPRPKFRWCTERLKIMPSTRFITSVVEQHGEAILVLGTRKAESAARARVMERYERARTRERLSPNGDLPNSYVYTPVEDWTNDDVWMFLMQFQNPGATTTRTSSACTRVPPRRRMPARCRHEHPELRRQPLWLLGLHSCRSDKSMQAMIRNDEEKDWMLPLLELRNRLDPPKTPEGDRPLRDFRRMNGAVQLFHDRPIPGPYTQEARESWLRQVLEAQHHVRARGPEIVRDINLITLEELEAIRRIWVVEKHEIEDALRASTRTPPGCPIRGGALMTTQLWAPTR